MHVFELIIALLLAGAALTGLARRIGTPYPSLVALAGAGLALVPGMPTLTLDPELALTLFVAPVLLDAAFDSSPRDLRANWRAVTGLALGAVALTVIVVAVVVRLLVPTMPWAVAIALGAIVAPPDAAAATAVLKQLRPPHRLMVILEGESLFNDASALLVYRLAVGVAVAGAMSPMEAIPMLLLVTAGSGVLAWVLARVIVWALGRVEDVAIAVLMQFCGCFAVWILAERLHLSGILTVVVFAMLASRRSATLTPARVRIPSYAVWELAVFVLNVLAFILVGFQLEGILARIDDTTLLQYTGIAGAVCAAAIGARIAWVVSAAAVSRWRKRLKGFGRVRGEGVGLSSGAAAVVGWCGMRGIVTLAAALALPATTAGGAPLPFRDLVVFCAFGVVLGTLVLQGMTLRPLMSVLRLEDDGAVEREVQMARVEVLQAALGAVNASGDDEMSELLRHRYQVLLGRARAGHAARPAEQANGADADVQQRDALSIRAATSAERARLVAMRNDGTIGAAAFQVIEHELDLEELHFDRFATAEAPSAS